MSTPQEKANPTDAEEKAEKSEVGGRTTVPRDDLTPNTTVPQEKASPDTTVPQD
jgi:hypothetical protein